MIVNKICTNKIHNKEIKSQILYFYNIQSLIIDTINENVINILKFSKIKDITHRSDIFPNPTECRAIGFGSLESMKAFVLQDKAAHYFFNIKRILREYYSEKNYSLSENYLDKTIVDFLILCKSSKMSDSDVASHVKKWLEKLDSVNQYEYRILLPVNHYDYNDHFTIDNITIAKIDSDLIKKYFAMNKQIPNNLHDVDYFIKSNNTDIGAIITVKAHDVDAAQELAEESLDKFISSIKLFDSGSFISTRKYSYEQINYMILIHNKSIGSLQPSRYNYYTLCRTTPSEEFYKKLENTWGKLASFLYSEHMTAFQKSIFSSMYWYGSIDSLRDSNVKKFLYYLIGLEKLLLKKHERQKGKKFGEHSAIIFSGDQKHAEFYKKYYDKRNDLVHDENVRIYDEEVTGLQINLRYLLLDMIEKSDKYSDVESYYKDEYKIKL